MIVRHASRTLPRSFHRVDASRASLLLLVVLFLVVSPSLQNESLGFQTEGESLTSRFIEQYLSEIEKFKAPGM
jgi:hypothetical protein